MDGRLAVLFFIIGLTDMGLNDCKTGCLARTPAQSALALSYGDVIFQQNTIGRETYLRYDMGTSFGPFQPAIGVSMTDSQDIWLGLGATHTTEFWQNAAGTSGGYAQLSFLPGVYAQGSGPNLGHVIEFRSGAEIGYQAKSGLRVGLSYDHRSNGDIATLNPGLETLQLRVSVPLN